MVFTSHHLWTLRYSGTAEYPLPCDLYPSTASTVWFLVYLCNLLGLCGWSIFLLFPSPLTSRSPGSWAWLSPGSPSISTSPRSLLIVPKSTRPSSVCTLQLTDTSLCPSTTMSTWVWSEPPPSLRNLFPRLKIFDSLSLSFNFFLSLGQYSQSAAQSYWFAKDFSLNFSSH